MEVTNKFGLTPLQIASIKCHKHCLEVLLKYGANFKTMTDYHETVLHLACRGVWVR